MVELIHFLIQQQKEYVVLTIKHTYICSFLFKVCQKYFYNRFYSRFILLKCIKVYIILYFCINIKEMFIYLKHTFKNLTR